MTANWLTRAPRWAMLCVLGVAGCDGASDQQSTDSQQTESALVKCGLPGVSMASAAGKARAPLGKAMTLPVPATIPVSGGPANATATLTYSLSSDGDRPLNCRYTRSGNVLKLESCEREVDATTWLEASAVDLTVSDPAAVATLSICPVAPALDLAAVTPPANEAAFKGDQLPNGRDVGFDALPGALTKQDVDSYVARARADRRVQPFLGERNAFLYSLPAGNPKSARADGHALKLIFYSHSNNQTVEVTANRGAVQSVQKIQLWPSEGQEEIDQAIALAKQDPRLAGRVNDLNAGGMVWQPTENVSYLNHRVMDIRFYDATLVSRYFATVDLTDLKVQNAGAVP